MNYNPRKITLALAATAALIVGPTGCTRHDAPVVHTPAENRPDCDLGDLEQGDKDCNDPVAFAEAVHRYGSTKVAAAKRKYAEKVAREKEQKARENLHKRIKSLHPTPVRPAAAPLVIPTTKSTKSNSGIGFRPFGKSRHK